MVVLIPWCLVACSVYSSAVQKKKVRRREKKRKWPGALKHIYWQQEVRYPESNLQKAENIKKLMTSLIHDAYLLVVQLLFFSFCFFMCHVDWCCKDGIKHYDQEVWWKKLITNKRGLAPFHHSVLLTLYMGVTASSKCSRDSLQWHFWWHSLTIDNLKIKLDNVK